MELFDTVITEEAKQRVQRVLESGYLSEGKLVREFEEELERVFGYKGVAVDSGTSALHLTLHEIGVCEGSEVIIPAQTFVATGMAVLYCGASIVFADIDVETGNISVDDVRAKINHKTRAVIAVSWGGTPCDLEALQTLCDEKSVYLIQDNAQALGATYRGLPITNWGDFSCFSFQVTKHLTTGDGGLIVANDEIDRELLRMLRWFSIDRDNNHPDETGERQYTLWDIGFKAHMNDYEAALGLGNLNGIQERISRRRDVALRYCVELRINPVYDSGSSYWLYDLLIQDRSEFMRAMKSRNIPVSVVHVGIDKHPIFNGTSDLPNQRYWDKHHVCLPCHSSLTDEDVERVIHAVNLGW